MATLSVSPVLTKEVVMRKHRITVLWGVLRHNLMLVLFVPLASVICGAAFFFHTGISGYSGNPATNSGKTCRDCHSGGAEPTVQLDGPSHTVAGHTYGYTLTISGGTKVAGGFDVSVTEGTLAATDPQTKILNSEVVQTDSRTADPNGNVSWSFNWTSPPAAASTTMYGS